MPWIEEEEILFKAKLSGFTVTDAVDPSGKTVKVWFRYPQMEIQDADYPFLTIDLIGVSEALDRAQRGGQMRPTVTGYRPPDMATDPDTGKTFVTEWPMAMDLSYQVTTWARNQKHDRELIRQIWATFPGRYGSLGGNASPYVRPFSAQLLSMTPGDRIDEFGKRLFRKMFTLKIFSELWASEVKQITDVTSIDITMPINVSGDDWFSNITCFEN